MRLGKLPAHRVAHGHSNRQGSAVKSALMRIKGSARAAVALVAAYAVALQTILLVFGGSVTGAAGFAGLPICSHFGDGTSDQVPSGHGRECVAACLTGCSCGAVAVPTRAASLSYAPEPSQVIAALGDANPAIRQSAICAHHSRAPPFG